MMVMYSKKDLLPYVRRVLRDGIKSYQCQFCKKYKYFLNENGIRGTCGEICHPIPIEDIIEVCIGILEEEEIWIGNILL